MRVPKREVAMQEASHHGQIVRQYRELKAGITQEELARRIGRSRRTVVNIEQLARVGDIRLRRTLAWALQIPPELLGLEEVVLPDVPVLTPVVETPAPTEKNLGRLVIETFTDNLRMRFDLYYLGHTLASGIGLNEHIGELMQLLRKGSLRDRQKLLVLLCHNYQLKGMIARDQLDYAAAESCFKQSSLIAQEAECAELNALTMQRQAVVYVWQKRLDEANQLYETAREISRRSPPALRAYLATGHAEVQGLLGDSSCLVSLSDARNLLRRVDVEDDHLLLLRSTRCSERSVSDGWLQCQTHLGKPGIAIEGYDRPEKLLDLGMIRKSARLYIRYAEALFASRDLSCCFYAIEGLKIARSVGSQYNIWQVKELAVKLRTLFPNDKRVKELVQAL